MKVICGKVLVVDDEEPVRKLCERALSLVGMTVQKAQDAEEALALLDREPFDCVLTDIGMPGAKNGAALTEEIKERFPSTDVIVMTGAPSVETSVFTLKRGALDYLTKPFAPQALQAVMTRCLEKRRLSPELDKEEIARRELEAAYVELQKVERRKDSFMSIVSHELRTPLTAAISAVELLKTGDLPPEKKARCLEMIESGLARESGVVEDLLAYSALRAGGLKLDFRELDLGELLGGLVENYRSVWEEKELRVRVDVSPSIGALRADAGRLTAAFKHLLLNAVRFNRKGGRVDIAARAEPGGVSVTFSDTGIGIAPEAREQIFDSFYQVAQYMTREVGGLGLGLSIVRGIVEAHGGTVSADARTGGGSVFTVFLPRDRREGGL